MQNAIYNAKAAVQGAQLDRGCNSAAVPVAPAAEVMLGRFNHLLERAASIAERQDRFLDRVRGSQPKDACKGGIASDPVSVFARLEGGLNILDGILDQLQGHTVAMENLA